MNDEGKKGNLSSSEFDLKNGKVLVSDQNTLGKPLGVAESSAEALKKVAAYAAIQGTELSGAVPIYDGGTDVPANNVDEIIPENAYGVGKANAVEAVTSFIMPTSSVTVEEPTNIGEVSDPTTVLPYSESVKLFGPDSGEAVVLESQPVSIVPPVEVSPNEGKISDPTKVLPYSESVRLFGPDSDATVVLENPETNQTMSIPEPLPLVDQVKLEGDQFQIDLPVLGGNDNSENPNLDPEKNGQGEGVEIDLPTVVQMNENKEVVMDELTPVQKLINEFKDSAIKLIEEFTASLNDELMNSNVDVKEVLNEVDSAVAEGLSKLDVAIKATTVTTPQYSAGMVPTLQAESPTSLGL